MHELDTFVNQNQHQNLLQSDSESKPAAYESLGNTTLPIYAQKAEIIAAITENPVTILVAQTGAGKSTQVPQYALEAGFETIFLTQPRRRAAMNVAERIQAELGEVLGRQTNEALGHETAQQLVSYQHGGGLTGSRDAAIKVVTDGLHLNRDGNSAIRSNQLWIIDEVHEWNENLELLVALGKQQQEINPNFKMVLMSATMDAHKLADYLTDEGFVPPVIEVAGRMFSVEYSEEPQSTVPREVVKQAIDIFENPEKFDSANTIQVFAEGKQEIQDIIDKVRTTLPPHILQKTTLIPLHAKMTPEAQAPAYEDFPGVKIVVQTKMGQTSMTIPRTRAVISSGMERRIELDEEGTPALLRLPISQDDLDQQMGRAGRTSEGRGILTRLDEKTPFIAKAQREKRPVPEILRSDIDRLTLYLAARGQDIAELDSYHVIAPVSIDRSIRRVTALEALDSDGFVTSIGRRMSELPLSLPMGRAVVHAERTYPNVKGYMAAIAAAKEVGGLRLFERGGTTNWKELTDDTSSDHLAHLDIFIAIQDMELKDMHAYDLDVNNVIRAREHFSKVAKKVNADPYKPLKNPTADERAQLRECIAVGSINSIYLPVGEGLYELLGKSAILREISNRSVTAESRSAVVGEPRRVQIIRAGQTEEKHIIEDVTEIAIADLGRIATSLTRWQSQGFTKRGGRYMQVERQLLGKNVIGSRELPATPSPLLRARIIEDYKVAPPPTLSYLNDISRSINKLDQKASKSLHKLTDAKKNEWIAQAAPADITDISLLENNMRIFVEQQGITQEQFVSKDEEASILKNAPASLTLGEVSLGLKYIDHKAIARKYTVDMIQRLQLTGSAVQLADGRNVFFMYDEKPYTLQQLIQKLINIGEL